MHGSRHDNQQLIADLIDKLPAQLNCEVLVCTPFVYLQEVERQIRDSGIQLGGQSVCAEASRPPMRRNCLPRRTWTAVSSVAHR